MEIRFAQNKDIPGIIELLKQVGQVHHEGRPDIFRPGTQKYDENEVAEIIKNPQAPVFVAVKDGKVLGYCFCVLTEHHGERAMTDRKELYIDDLCVDEGCRGQGVGKILYGEVVRFAKRINCAFITLNVWCCNAPAMLFYEKLGLTPRKINMEMALEEN